MECLKLRGIHFNNKSVVDLGSGTGVLSRALHKEGATVVGVNPSKELIEEAKEMNKKELDKCFSLNTTNNILKLGYNWFHVKDGIGPRP